MPPVVLALELDRAPDIVSVLCDAFRDYPVMRHVVGAGHADYDRCLRDLIAFFVYRRLRHAPALGVERDGRLVGAAVLTLPGEAAMPPDVAAKREHLWRLGAAALHRYEAFAAATKPFAVAEPHHHLNMIGVRRAYAGTGLARPLLEAVARLSDEDPASAGVSLTTEVAQNVTLYERFGYRVVGHARVSAELETWGMWKPGASGS